MTSIFDDLENYLSARDDCKFVHLLAIILLESLFMIRVYSKDIGRKLDPRHLSLH